jgi:hypothetical protein
MTLPQSVGLHRSVGNADEFSSRMFGNEDTPLVQHDEKNNNVDQWNQQHQEMPRRCQATISHRPNVLEPKDKEISLENSTKRRRCL